MSIPVSETGCVGFVTRAGLVDINAAVADELAQPRMKLAFRIKSSNPAIGHHAVRRGTAAAT